MTNAENETKTIKNTYLTSNYFVRNGNSSKPFTLTYGNENSSILMPAGKAIYANVLGNNVPLSGGDSASMPDYSRKSAISVTTVDAKTVRCTAPNNGYIMLTVGSWGDGTNNQQVLINNVVVGEGFTSSSASWQLYYHTFWYQVKKNDIITVKLTNLNTYGWDPNAPKAYFYPYKN